MQKYFVLNKPYGYVSQFTDEAKHPGLQRLIQLPKDVYPVGRLDSDSEGLLVLTNDNYLKHNLISPQFKHKRTYAVQVDGIATQVHINLLMQGVQISVEGKPYKTLPPNNITLLHNVNFKERTPPVRFRKSIPTSWIELTLIEGKNRQVRKMTAAVGIPTLRLIRTTIEDIKIEDYKEGELKELDKSSIYKMLKIKVPK